MSLFGPRGAKDGTSMVGELLHWSCTNLEMAQSDEAAKVEKDRPTHFMIRTRLFKGLNDQKMSVGSLGDDERLKLVSEPRHVVTSFS